MIPIDSSWKTTHSEDAPSSLKNATITNYRIDTASNSLDTAIVEDH